MLDAATRLAELDVGALPICGEDDRLKGMLTDRDIVTKVLAQRRDPQTTKAGDIASGDGTVVTIGADDPIERGAVDDVPQPRPPAAGDRRQRLVGIISQADIARNYDEEKVGELVDAISS